MANGAEPGLTIDQLAQRTGMTVRNIRAHQSRGLLDPPDVRGRTGYYGRAHVERIDLIRRLQADGYSLDLIGRMLVTAGDQSAEALRFTEALRQPWADEQPRVVEAHELVDRYGTDDPELLAKAEELGLLRPLGNGHWEEMSPRLGRAGAELTDLGIPAKEALRLVERVRRNAQSAARTFTHLFVEEVWKPFQRDGSPEERWPEILDALERLRPLASDSLMAVFLMAMEEEVEEALGRELKRARRDANEATNWDDAPRYPDLADPAAGGVFLCPRPSTHRGVEEPWPAETYESPPPWSARSASGVTIRRRSPSETTRTGSSCASTAAGAASTRSTRRRVSGFVVDGKEPTEGQGAPGSPQSPAGRRRRGQERS